MAKYTNSQDLKPGDFVTNMGYIESLSDVAYDPILITLQKGYRLHNMTNKVLVNRGVRVWVRDDSTGSSWADGDKQVPSRSYGTPVLLDDLIPGEVVMFNDDHFMVVLGKISNYQLQFFSLRDRKVVTEFTGQGNSFYVVPSDVVATIKGLL